MKFSQRIFFITFFMIVISFGIGGFALVNTVFSDSLNSKIQAACDSNRYAAASFYAISRNYLEIGMYNSYPDNILKSFSRQLSSGNSDTTITVGAMYDMKTFDSPGFIYDIEENTREYRFSEAKGKKYIQVVCRIDNGSEDYYIETVTDISEIYKIRDSYIGAYQIVLLCVSLAASLVLVLLSKLITNPLVKLSKATKRIADGDFSVRADCEGSSELKELSQSFNLMADNVESHIEQLEDSARRRDDFVADFTHELKTPLTSVIGYADMLRSYDMNAEERRKCAEFIYKEGRRLEALSSNLLQIIVLKNQNISMERVSTDALLSETGNTVEFLLEKYNIKLNIKFESAVLLAEQSLLKTLLYNLIDNACKASKPGQSVELTGTVADNRYRFTVTDCGMGIPDEELKRITEPFYMVDKSRSRRLGGAGLGLALCNEIAALHGSSLYFLSEVGKGTEVSFSVSLFMKGEDYEQA